MEVSLVRKRLKNAIERSREQAQQRRQDVAEAEKAYQAFLDEVATPLVRQLANVLKVENYAFTVFTPGGGGLRLASDRTRDDYVEFALDGTGSRPQVVGRIRQVRGSRTLEDERPIKPGAAVEDLTDEDVLDFLLKALEPFLER